MRQLKLLFFVVLILSYSCRSVQVISFEQFQDFQANSTIDTPKIRWDGFYNNINGSKHLDTLFANTRKGNSPLVVPEIFFSNGIYCVGLGGSDTTEILKFFEPYRYSSTDGWGVFSIDGDTITSLHYEFFMIWRLRFPRRENIIVRYQGKILNDTTIVNWRRVPPHPDLDFNHSDTIPTVLQFIPFAQKTAIDSNYIFIK